MQKKIIALAIAAAVSAPAFADTSNVTVYGVANVSFDVTDTGSNPAGTAGFNNNKVSSNTSRLGLKGSEDLGDGLSAIWQIEQLIAIDGGQGAANSFATRNTFAGLSSTTAGTVLLGRHDTPYKLATRGFDVFADSIADNRAVMGGGLNTVVGGRTAGTTMATGTLSTGAGASFDGRQTDVVAYISPAMSGFTGIIAYVAGAEGQTVSTQNKGSAWSLAGLYGNGPLNINAAYEVHDIGNAPGTIGVAALATGVKETAWKVGASYAIDAFTINGVYEKTDDNFGGSAADVHGLAAGTNVYGHSAYYLSGKYSFGANAVKLAYGNANDGAVANTGAKQVSVGFDHNLSKRTSVYALYTQLSNDSAATYALGSAGIGNGTVFLNGAGSKPSAVSLGMKHTF